jgi:hypothetical protein
MNGACNLAFNREYIDWLDCFEVSVARGCWRGTMRQFGVPSAHVAHRTQVYFGGWSTR